MNSHTTTLPVTKGQLIWSKLLVSVFWAVVSGLVGILASFILSVGTDAQDVLFNLHLSRFFEPFTTGQSVVIVLVIVAAVLLYLAYTYLRCYAAMAVGQSFGNHKLLLSVVAYFAIGMALSVLSNAFAFGVLPHLNLEALLANLEDPALFFHGTMWVGALLSLLYSALFYFVTRWFLQNKLNLG